ncbi:MAG: hypothetical protein AABO58_13115 [Acidobacteriota bacterium]
MRSVSKRIRRTGVILALFTILSAQAALAAPRGDDGSGGWRGSFERVKQLIVKAFEDCRLGAPPG